MGRVLQTFASCVPQGSWLDIILFFVHPNFYQFIQGTLLASVWTCKFVLKKKQAAWKRSLQSKLLVLLQSDISASLKSAARTGLQAMSSWTLCIWTFGCLLNTEDKTLTSGKYPAVSHLGATSLLPWKHCCASLGEPAQLHLGWSPCRLTAGPGCEHLIEI